MLDTDVLAEQPACCAANELHDADDGVFPTRGIDGGIVDDADQVAQLLLII
ncbi:MULTISPECIES: hypothetical protein [unclassified Bradyrhizobium]|uniref:hypothetical protein n=1 Tax=unclassified Bradyrhizobium TaxID=2631580 RepID=UPI001FF87A76|nr:MULTISPECIES: hypothetical protein [unclassified Bradyrhizobium]MCK1289742.1 hypothetical protein [Bradyrhizobium sp. 30]MCK1466150.1 hypothetical protein [Bradyrhizobium sp. CW10]